MPQVERYRLMRTVASGGMAQVVEAVACGLHGFERRVAIKRLLPQHAGDGERRRMFLEEARIGSRLHHGCIVPIFDYGVIDGTEFLAMELVDGLDALRAVTAGSPEGRTMPEGIALHIVAEVAHALAYLHGLAESEANELEPGDGCSSREGPRTRRESIGIVHRDVSPPNILLSWNGDVRLSDFGIAQSGAAGERALGGVTGKPQYMAPEQARGEVVSTAADIYALGATLHAILGGRRVSGTARDANGAKVSALDQVAQAQQWGVSAETCALIAHCLAQDPERRAKAAEVAARAGALASMQLGRDGRGALREWLEPLRACAQKHGSLDDLMGLTLVPIGLDGARVFTITGTTTNESAEQESARLGMSRIERWRSSRSKRRPSVRRRALWMHAYPALTVAAVAGATLLVSSFIHPRHPIAQERAPQMAASMLSGSVRRGAAAPPPTVLASDDPSIADLPYDGSDLTDTLGAPGAVERLRASPRHVTGWIEVGGPSLAGRVAIDGRFVGASSGQPLRFELPVGPHRLVVTASRSGAVLLSTNVQISALQVPAAPLRIDH